MILRPYQQEAVDGILSQFEKSNSTLAVMATGLGKTVVFSHVIKDAVKRGRVMVVAHREELIRQAAEKIEAVTGIKPDVEMAKDYANEGGLIARSPVIVSTVQTQCSGYSGAGRMCRFVPEDFSLLVIDEAHHSTASQYRRVINYYRQNPSCKVLGVTATPDRHDEEALGQIFETVAFEYGILEGINEGWLVPIEQQFVTVEGLDFSHVRTTLGDLNATELEEVLKRETVIQGMTGATVNIAKTKKTLVFAASVPLANLMTVIFNRYSPGIAATITGDTKSDERERIVKQFRSGELRYLVNVAVAIEGFDVPDVEVVSMCQPTKSRPRYCLDEQTEILTPDGWKRYDQDVSTAYAYDPTDGSLRTSTVRAKIIREQLPDEKMWGIDGRHLSIRVSDKHRMIIENRHGRKRTPCKEVVTADRMPKDGCKIPVCGIEYSESAALTDDEIRFIGLVLTDGNINPRNGQITLYQSERYPKCIEYIRRVINECGFKFGHSVETKPTNFGERKPLHRWTISNGKPRERGSRLRGWNHLEKFMDKQFSPELEKLNRRQLLVLLEAMNVGDGRKFQSPSINWKPRTMSICSGRKQVCDRLQSLCVRRGIRCNISTNGMGVGILNIDTTRDHVHLPTTAKDRVVWAEKPDVGRVWCIEVDTGFIVCRRNGKPFVTGNCQMIGRGTRPLNRLVDRYEEPEARRGAILQSAKPNVLVIDFTGNSGKHKLITTADILGGNYSEAVQEMAIRSAKKAGGPVNIIDEMAKAEHEERERRAKEIEAKKKHITAKVQYSTRSINPFDVFDMQPVSEPGYYKGEMATENQRAFLDKFGVDTAKLTKFEASRLVVEMKHRLATGKCTYKQAKVLQKYGYPTDVSFQEASRLIDGVAKNGWRRPVAVSV